MYIQRCCLFDRISAKISKFKLKQVYATKNTSMYPEHLIVHLSTKNLFSCVVPSFCGVVGCANNAMRNHDKRYHKIPSERDERGRIQKQRSER
jgi:hypothetical protein